MDRGAAYHEAGHAVVSHVLGRRRCVLVTIVPNDDCGGRVEYEPFPDWFQPEVETGPEAEAIIRAEVVGFLAGSSAQERIDGYEEAVDSSYGDFIKAAELVSYVCGSPEAEQEYLRSCAEEAAVLVAAHWPTIEALADALLKRGTLTGDEMVSIMGTPR